MGLKHDVNDAIAREQWREAFFLSRQVLNRKGSKRLMSSWIETCYEMLEKMGKVELLPDYFNDLSVYGQRYELNKLEL